MVVNLDLSAAEDRPLNRPAKHMPNQLKWSVEPNIKISPTDKPAMNIILDELRKEYTFFRYRLINKDKNNGKFTIINQE